MTHPTRDPDPPGGAAEDGSRSGLLGGEAEDASCCDERCVTCGDVAEPMRVLRIDAERGLALCEEEGGARRTVETALVEPVSEGDLLLVHAGTAIGREAAEVFG